MTRRKTVAVGATAVQALYSDAARVSYRVLGASTNIDYVYIGKDSNVTVAEPYRVGPMGFFEDSGDPRTVYRGEVWLVSATAAQSAIIEEVLSF